MNLLIVSATPFEILPLTEQLQKSFKNIGENQYQSDDLIITVLISGIGVYSTIYSLTKALSKKKYDLIVNAGIGGALNMQLSKGDVVNIITDQFGDVGIEEANGNFVSIFELELVNPNEFPFKNQVLKNSTLANFKFLPIARGITVNKVHGNSESIKRFKNKFDADVESMEGAAVFYVCLMEDQPFMQIRSISNYVEERNRENWDIELAIGNLNNVLAEIVGIFNEN